MESGDIAVLVRTNNEAAMIAGKLKQRRIQSVLLSRQSVFDSAEADSLSALIGFWLNPRQTDWLRFVLTGVLFGYTAKEIYELNHNEHQLLKWLESSAEAMENGGKAAFLPPCSSLPPYMTSKHACSKGQRTQPDQLLSNSGAFGRRRQPKPQPCRPAKWLNEQISRARSGHFPSDAQTIRLESDEKLVKSLPCTRRKVCNILWFTAPSRWDTKDNSKENWKILHTENHETELLAKSQTSEAELSHLADEKTAEDLRLLYVAPYPRRRTAQHLRRRQQKLYAKQSFCLSARGLPDADRENVSQSYKSATDVVEMLKTNWQRFIKNAPENTEFAFTEEAPPGNRLPIQSPTRPSLERTYHQTPRF